MHLKDAISTTKHDDIKVQFIRYTLVGGIAFALDFAIYTAAIYWFGIHYLVAAPLGFIAGLATNYSLSVAWVFSNRKYNNRLMELIVFSAIGLVGIGLTEVMLYILVDLLGAGYISARLITTGAVYIWNFLARKLILFNSPITTNG